MQNTLFQDVNIAGCKVKMSKVNSSIYCIFYLIDGLVYKKVLGTCFICPS